MACLTVKRLGKLWHHLINSLSRGVRKDTGQGLARELAAPGVGVLHTQAAGGGGRGRDSPHAVFQNLI